ncbi:hypothetical protein FPV67DRAFT_1408467 [Lyophyllum atratum]|nr:hypothetical protein FPV67DRAFT_1408467 [Lyophyllum atratum]
MANSLVQSARKAVTEFRKLHQSDGLEAETASDADIDFWNTTGVKGLQSRWTDRRPDIITVDKEAVQVKPNWLLVRQVIEFKRRSEEEEEDYATASTNSLANPLSDSGGSSAAGPPTRAASSERPSVGGVPSPDCSRKRKYSGSEEGNDSKRPRTVPKVPEITTAQAQLAIYALECLDASTRHYISGVFVNRFQVSLWYYDRSCVISTVTFNFDRHPALLVLVLYALSACDNKHAGFDPYLVTPPSINSQECPEGKEYWQEIIGYEIHLPTSDKYPGRGKFRIEDILFAYRGLIGRGTMVYKVAPLVEDQRGFEALKIAWPSVTRPLEAKMIEQLHSRLPLRWREHIPELTYSATLTAEELQLPRFELLKTNPIDQFEDRQMHTLAMKLYGKLWEVGSVEAFQEVFIDCVECHYHAYQEGHVLHRDLSQNNLMFKLCEDGTTKGILNDWDMASYVEDNNEINKSTATQRTGTRPFVAYELLTDADRDLPPHLYRHDLESFFYILLWAAVHYDFTHKKKLERIEMLNDWDGSDYQIMRCAKISFNMYRTERRRVLDCVRPECKSQLLPWLMVLGDLFQDACMAQQRLERSSPDWDDKTLGGHITFANFMKALGRTPR